MPDFFHACAVVDRDFRITWANDDYRERFFGGKCVSGRTCHEVIHDSARPCSAVGQMCPLEVSRVRNGPARATHLHPCGAGESAPTAVECHPLHDGDLARAGRFLLVSQQLSPCAHGGAMEAVTTSSSTSEVLHLITMVAPTDTTVLIDGETGTGKELVARAIHALSGRANGNFVAVDCSAYREWLLESELFGHERGAFTGAVDRKEGLVEEANGGTLFLDEVGDIPASVQLKLLRLLETRTFRRVGGTRQLTSDFRLICASHPDLQEKVESGAVRRDFYYRINALAIRLCPLRERREDLPTLIASLVGRIKCGDACRVDEEAMTALKRHTFPGNVRELLHIIERGCILSAGGPIGLEHLPADVIDPGIAPVPDPRIDVLPLSEVQTRYLLWVASNFKGNRKELAQQLGLSERTLYRKIRGCMTRNSTARRGSRNDVD